MIKGNTFKGKQQSKKITQVARIPRQVKYITYTNTSATSSLTTANPAIFNLNPLSQGTSNTTRVGAKVRMASMDLFIQIGWNNSNSSSAQNFRIVVIRDVACEGVLTTNGECFTSAGGVDSLQNVTSVNPDRFLVLYDYVFKSEDYGPIREKVRDAAGAAVEWNGIVLPAHRVRMNLNFVTDYSRSNAGTVADIDMNGITLFVLTDNPNANTIFVNVSNNIRFYDE